MVQARERVGGEAAGREHTSRTAIQRVTSSVAASHSGNVRVMGQEERQNRDIPPQSPQGERLRKENENCSCKYPEGDKKSSWSPDLEDVQKPEKDRRQRFGCLLHACKFPEPMKDYSVIVAFWSTPQLRRVCNCLAVKPGLEWKHSVTQKSDPSRATPEKGTRSRPCPGTRGRFPQINWRKPEFHQSGVGTGGMNRGELEVEWRQRRRMKKNEVNQNWTGK
ncbi:hypothetical protein B0H10DRAFT_2360925 [Mycena sp. CBHHK59/15]|nr:hypothetical protein B0H10DRAFT_2360925 [Mycena sp. CBHHK59/15]